MDTELKQRLEEITSEIKEIIKLLEQGCTSQVHKIVTDEACYLLKSSFDERYRDWLNTEAQVLKKLNQLNRVPVPKFYSFIQAKDSSHLLMSFEEGITLTSALSKARDNSERKNLIRSFGRFSATVPRNGIG
ncbi:phosphotransferase [Ornithinibacillus halotolerans]|uniref:Aminoglycoside phosphotransferase domain-containing protein n=1 Tax=Ornithinibacillus halotolerans TaxID=1274357 RepID=A0A916RVS7_9BACI|nr:phosphotransferase [Ornithinibacillus halotolerans]GGA71673.1 hypothetical protein GCM10008025_14460 [Ornithinibacillus halotolerans]